MLEGVNRDTFCCGQRENSESLIRENEKKIADPPFFCIFGFREVLVLLCDVPVWNVVIYNIQQESFL